MAMGWIETIRFIGLDLQVATVFAAASLDVVARSLKSKGLPARLAFRHSDRFETESSS